MDHTNKFFYNNLTQLLEETSEWPCEYLFKFIVKSDENKINVIELQIFKYWGENIEGIIIKKINGFVIPPVK